MYHHHQQKVSKCVRKNHKHQRLSDLYVTRSSHSLHKDFHLKAPNPLNFKRVRDRKYNRIRLNTHNEQISIHVKRSLAIQASPKKNVLLPLFANAVKSQAKRVFSKQPSNNVISNTGTLKAMSIIFKNRYYGGVISVYHPLYHKLNYINKLFMKHPFIAAALCVTLEGMVADLLAQSKLESKSKAYMNLHVNYKYNIGGLDMLRILQFGLYCFIAHGVMSYVLINKLYFRIFPGYSMKQTVKKVLFEEFIYMPFGYLPFFYLWKELSILKRICNKEDISIKDAWNRAIAQYKETFIKDNCACLMLWIPCQMITFGLMPKHLRVPWISLVSFIWFVGLSHFRSDKEEAAKDNAGAIAFEDKIENHLSYNEKRLNSIKELASNVQIAV